MTCRDELLYSVKKIIKSKGDNQFTVAEVVNYMQNNRTKFAESTIRTHITSKCCANAPANHAITFNDFERIEKGIYKLL